MSQHVQKAECVGMSIALALDPPFDGYAHEAFSVLGWLVTELDQGTEHVKLSTLEAARRVLRQLDADIPQQAKEGE